MNSAATISAVECGYAGPPPHSRPESHGGIRAFFARRRAHGAAVSDVSKSHQRGLSVEMRQHDMANVEHKCDDAKGAKLYGAKFLLRWTEGGPRSRRHR